MDPPGGEKESKMDIRRNNTEKLDPDEIESIVLKVTQLSWVKNLLREYIELLNLCESSEEKDLINSLIDKFIVLDTQKLSVSLKDIKNKISEQYNINAKNTIFYAFADDSKPDGSQFIIQSFKNKFQVLDGWDESNFSNNLLNIKSHGSRFKKIFLIDDFIGTGNTTSSKYAFAIRELAKQSIQYDCLVVLSVACMEFTTSRLESEGIPFYSPYLIRKGITDNYSREEVEQKKKLMLQIESRLNKKNGKHFFPFGYEQSEALFSIEEINIPDNVFPVFWWPYGYDGLRNTMFKGLR